MTEAESERSVNRSPSSDWLPCESLAVDDRSAERSLRRVVGRVSRRGW